MNKRGHKDDEDKSIASERDLRLIRLVEVPRGKATNGFRQRTEPDKVTRDEVEEQAGQKSPESPGDLTLFQRNVDHPNRQEIGRDSFE